MKFYSQKIVLGTSLVAQWFKIHLPMQGHRFDPWPGKIPHAMQQLSPWATTTKALVPRARAPQQEKPPQWEAHAPQRSSPCASQLQKSHMQQRRHNAAKTKKIIFFKKVHLKKKKFTIILLLTTQNLWGSAKAVQRGKFIAIQSYLKKQKTSQINNLTLHLKQLKKEKQKKPQS